MCPNQHAPGEGTEREQQPTWAAHIPAVPARATQKALLPETAAVRASGEERPGLLVTLFSKRPLAHGGAG